MNCLTKLNDDCKQFFYFTIIPSDIFVKNLIKTTDVFSSILAHVSYFCKVRRSSTPNFIELLKQKKS